MKLEVYLTDIIFEKCFLPQFPPHQSMIRSTLIPWPIFHITHPIILVIRVIIKKLTLIRIKPLVFTHNLFYFLFSRLLYLEVSMLEALESCWSLLWIDLQHPLNQINRLHRRRRHDLPHTHLIIMRQHQVNIGRQLIPIRPLLLTRCPHYRQYLINLIFLTRTRKQWRVAI